MALRDHLLPPPLLPVLKLQNHATTPGCLGAGDLDLSPHAHTASAFLALSPPPPPPPKPRCFISYRNLNSVTSCFLCCGQEGSSFLSIFRLLQEGGFFFLYTADQCSYRSLTMGFTAHMASVLDGLLSWY